MMSTMVMMILPMTWYCDAGHRVDIQALAAFEAVFLVLNPDNRRDKESRHFSNRMVWPVAMMWTMMMINHDNIDGEIDIKWQRGMPDEEGVPRSFCFQVFFENCQTLKVAGVFCWWETGFPVEQLRPTATDCCVQLQLAEAGHVGKQLQVQVRLMKLRHRCKTRLLSLRILWISAGVQSSWQKASVLARSYTGSNRSYTFSELSPPPAAPLLGSRYVDTISCKFCQRSAVFFICYTDRSYTSSCW